MSFGINEGEYLNILVVGVGSRLRGDDSAGPMTIDRLKELIDSRGCSDHLGIDLLDADVMPENFTKPIRESGVDMVLFIDAVDMGLGPGEIRRIPADRVDATIPCSHSLPMSYIMGYVGEKIETVELIGIQAEVTGLFQEMSPTVKEACSRLAEMIYSGRALEIDVKEKIEKGEGEGALNYCW